MRMSRRAAVAACGVRESPFSMAYSGAHTVREVEFEGVRYAEWALTGSGRLTVEGPPTTGLVWLCGGGAAGVRGGQGGSGGYVASAEVVLANVSVAIGAGGTGSGGAGGRTAFGGILAADGGTSTAGGSGGGAGGVYGVNAGTGAGVTTFPFGDQVNHTAHAPGGGGGGYRTSSATNGGNGGTNGGNGLARGGTAGNGGVGGATGGGHGGYAPTSGALWVPTAGSNYGAGGGGSAKRYEEVGSATGAGYQGVVYIRVAI